MRPQTVTLLLLVAALCLALAAIALSALALAAKRTPAADSRAAALRDALAPLQSEAGALEALIGRLERRLNATRRLTRELEAAAGDGAALRSALGDGRTDAQSATIAMQAQTMLSIVTALNASTVARSTASSARLLAAHNHSASAVPRSAATRLAGLELAMRLRSAAFEPPPPQQEMLLPDTPLWLGTCALDPALQAAVPRAAQLTRRADAGLPLVDLQPGTGVQFGSDGTEYIASVVAGGDGAIYGAGVTSATLTSAPSLGGWDAYAVRIGADGAVAWLSQFGSERSDFVRDMAVNSHSVFVVGTAFSDMAPNPEAFVARLDAPTGEVDWFSSFAFANDDGSIGVAVSETLVYVTGSSKGVPRAGLTNAGDADVFLVCFNMLGVQQWVTLFGTPLADFGRSLALGPDRIYLAGSTRGSLAADHAGVDDIVLGAFFLNGTRDWLWQLGTNESDRPNALVYDPAPGGTPALYLAGYATGSVNASHAYRGGTEAILIRAAPQNGAIEWIRQFGSTEMDTVVALAVHSDGVLAAGFAGATPSVDSVRGRYHGLQDAFVAQLDKSGEHLQLRLFGTPQIDSSGGLALSANGSTVFTGGHTRGSLFAGNKGDYDAFVASYALDGVCSS